jgi:hypothetical protein
LDNIGGDHATDDSPVVRDARDLIAHSRALIEQSRRLVDKHHVDTTLTKAKHRPMPLLRDWPSVDGE